jgi:hypothetical protein
MAGPVAIAIEKAALIEDVRGFLKGLRRGDASETIILEVQSPEPVVSKGSA